MEISRIDKELLEKKYPNDTSYLDKLKDNYPVQYLIGDVSFCGYTIKVNESVLIPRFETEYLVDKTYKLIQKLNLNSPTIIDIGTGSGCIAISLKKLIPTSFVSAIDISEEALNIAKENAKLNNVDITFLNQDILNSKISNYDVIISNPPYIAYDEEVAPEVKYEPSLALYANDQGLAFYKKIVDNLKLIHFKLCAFEIGATPKEKIINYVKKNLPDYQVICEKDFNNLDRYIFIYE